MATYEKNPFGFLVEFDNELDCLHDGKCAYEPISCGKPKHCWWFNEDDTEVKIIMKKKKADNYQVFLFESSDRNKASINIKFNKVILSDRTMVGFYNNTNGEERKVKTTCLPQDEFNFDLGLDILSTKAMIKELRKEYKRLTKIK